MGKVYDTYQKSICLQVWYEYLKSYGLLIFHIYQIDIVILFEREYSCEKQCVKADQKQWGCLDNVIIKGSRAAQRNRHRLFQLHTLKARCGTWLVGNHNGIYIYHILVCPHSIGGTLGTRSCVISSRRGEVLRSRLVGGNSFSFFSFLYLSYFITLTFML